jgi:hypothetical protein
VIFGLPLFLPASLQMLTDTKASLALCASQGETLAAPKFYFM